MKHRRVPLGGEVESDLFRKWNSQNAPPDWHAHTSALLGNRAGCTGKGGIGVGADQTYGTHHKDQDYRQHYCVFRDVLTFIV